MEILEGIRVLEVTEWGFVPSCGAVLGDWGAEVIKIEHPERGDGIRGLVTYGVKDGGVNFFVEQLFRNKRSVGIDIATPEGRDLLYRLAETSDIFLTSFLPDARERLGITFEDLEKVNPKIIYAKGHGQGQKGPDARRGGYDGLSFWARGGVADAITTPGEPHVQQRPAFGDFMGGMFLAGGIAGALFHRERTGEGIEVDVSLLGDAAWVLAPDVVAAISSGVELPKGSPKGVYNPLVGTYECADGRHLVLMMLQEPRFWPMFCETIGRADWLADPRWETPKMRRKARADIAAEIAALFRTQPRDHWRGVLDGSECIWGPLQTPGELADDPQVRANGYLLEVEHPSHGRIRLASSPVQFAGTPPTVRNPAPEVGADTEMVLLELGCSWDELAACKKKNVIT